VATGTILNVVDNGFHFTIAVRVTEVDLSVTDYTVRVATAYVATLPDASAKREFLRLSVKAQRDERLATTPAQTPIPIGGDLTL